MFSQLQLVVVGSVPKVSHVRHTRLSFGDSRKYVLVSTDVPLPKRPSSVLVSSLPTKGRFMVRLSNQITTVLFYWKRRWK